MYGYFIKKNCVQIFKKYNKKDTRPHIPPVAPRLTGLQAVSPATTIDLPLKLVLTSFPSWKSLLRSPVLTRAICIILAIANFILLKLLPHYNNAVLLYVM
jgi:hypothetical protein